MSVCHLQPKPTGKSRGCHRSHHKPQEAIKLSPTLIVLEQYASANLPACAGCDPQDSPTLIRIRIGISAFIRRAFLQPSCKNTDGLCSSSLQPASPVGLKAKTSAGQIRSQQQCWEENQVPNSQPSSLGNEIVA